MSSRGSTDHKACRLGTMHRCWVPDCGHNAGSSRHLADEKVTFNRINPWRGYIILPYSERTTCLFGLGYSAPKDILLEHFESQAVEAVNSFVFAASVMVFMYFTTAVARAHFRAASTVQDQLRTFSFRNDTRCYCCSVNHVNPKTGQRMFCDRQAISGCLEHWFGSDTAFDAVVQQDVSAAFQRGVMSCLVPYTWLTGATIPIAWLGVDYGLRSLWYNRDSWLAFSNTLYLLSMWLGTIPVLVALWLRIPRRFQQRRSTRCREVMLNLACSVLMGIMFLVVYMAHSAIVFSIPTYGIVTCSTISLLAAAICLGEWGRFFRRKSPA